MSHLGLLFLLAINTTPLAAQVSDTSGTVHTLPERNHPLLLIYEDQEGGKQNEKAKQVLGAFNRKDENRKHLTVQPVADLEKWNWWPARKYALADIQKIAAKKQSTIYIDWTGAMRRAWGLEKGKSNMVLFDGSGKVLFASVGPIDDVRLEALVKLLHDLGVE